MSDMSELSCVCCGQPLERLRYFPRQLLTADDMRAEQEHFREKARRHNRYLHGWGVVCGCTVEVKDPASASKVRVCPGYAVSPQGDEICIDQCIDVDLKVGAEAQPCSVQWPCPPLGEPPVVRDGFAIVYIAVRYAECFTRPVRLHPVGCGCDETGCEYSRIRESFEIKVLWHLPESHTNALKDDVNWCTAVSQLDPALMKRRHLYPVPPCPVCESDPWVVLASVRFPTSTTPVLSNNSNNLTISTDVRRVLLSTQRLQVAGLCLP